GLQHNGFHCLLKEDFLLGTGDTISPFQNWFFCRASNLSFFLQWSTSGGCCYLLLINRVGLSVLQSWGVLDSADLVRGGVSTKGFVIASKLQLVYLGSCLLVKIPCGCSRCCCYEEDSQLGRGCSDFEGAVIALFPLLITRTRKGSASSFQSGQRMLVDNYTSNMPIILPSTLVSNLYFTSQDIWIPAAP
ncbi:hypothetical protein MKW98_000838, partial [Papaver atlanticum]